MASLKLFGEPPQDIGDIIAVAAAAAAKGDDPDWCPELVQNALVRPYARLFTRVQCGRLCELGFDPSAEVPVETGASAADASGTEYTISSTFLDSSDEDVDVQSAAPDARAQVRAQLDALGGREGRYELLPTSDAQLDAPFRRTTVLAFECTTCGVRHTMRADRLASAGVEGLRCLCGDGAETYAYKNAYNSDTQIALHNYERYIHTRIGDWRVQTTPREFAHYPNNLLLKCVDCGRAQRTTTRKVFLTLRPCPCQSNVAS